MKWTLGWSALAEDSTILFKWWAKGRIDRQPTRTREEQQYSKTQRNQWLTPSTTKYLLQIWVYFIRTYNIQYLSYQNSYSSFEANGMDEQTWSSISLTGVIRCFWVLLFLSVSGVVILLESLSTTWSYMMNPVSAF